MISLLPTTGYANSTSESSQTAAAASSASDRAISVSANLSATTLSFDITETITATTRTESDLTKLTYSSLTIENKMPTGKLEVEKLELSDAGDYTLVNDASTEWGKLSINDKKLSMLVSCGSEVNDHDMSSPLTRKLEIANNSSISYTFSGHTGISSGYSGKIAQLVVTLSLKQVEPAALKLCGKSVTFKIAEKTWDGTLETSTDGKTWTTYSAGTTVYCGSENTIYVRGTDNTKISGYTTVDEEPNNPKNFHSGMTDGIDKSCISVGGYQVALSGDLNALLDYTKVKKGEIPESVAGAFCCLFKHKQGENNNGFTITDISGLILKRPTLKQEEYREMFSECGNIYKDNVFASIDAETVGALACCRMFENTCITTAPALPATKLEGKGCYYAMFSGCVCLTSAPALPALSVPAHGYDSMFCGARGIESAPALPATVLSEGCYQQMFSMCPALKSAPALPATALSEDCYSYMFECCMELQSLPKLPATVLPKRCYHMMFAYCDKIHIYTEYSSNMNTYRIPAEGSCTLPGDHALYDMFYDSGGTFKDTPSVNTTYYTTNEIVG